LVHAIICAANLMPVFRGRFHSLKPDSDPSFVRANFILSSNATSGTCGSIRLRFGKVESDQDDLPPISRPTPPNARRHVRIYESYAEMVSLQKFDRHQALGLIEVFSGALDNVSGEYHIILLVRPRFRIGAH